MFSGIIEAKAKIIRVEKKGSSLRISVALPKDWCIAKGQSIALDGMCTTALKSGRGTFSADLMPETLRVTTAGEWKMGKIVNAERSLKYGARVDGHFVQGHVECRGIIENGKLREALLPLIPSTRGIHKMENGEFRIRVPKDVLKCIVMKGSVAVNGVSLTVSKRAKDSFSIALIPHTLVHTNLGELKEGGVVNIETDMLARQIVAFIGKKA